MTDFEEKIKQKAEKWMHDNAKRCTDEGMNGYDFAVATCIAVTTEITKELQEEINNLNGIITAQKSALDKEYAINAQLQEQMDKMKSCPICKYRKKNTIG